MLMDVSSLKSFVSTLAALAACSRLPPVLTVLKRLPSDSPPPPYTPSFSPFRASPHLLFFTLFCCLFSLLVIFSFSGFQMAIGALLFFSICVWNLCLNVCSEGGRRVAVCLCAVQHINLLSSSGRQACACCTVCFSQSVGVAVCFWLPLLKQNFPCTLQVLL